MDSVGGVGQLQVAGCHLSLPKIGCPGNQKIWAMKIKEVERKDAYPGKAQVSILSILLH